MGEEPDHGESTYRGTSRLEGRVAIVTGGDSGIGRAVALAFAREGADVVMSYLEGEEEDGETTAHLVQDAGRRAVKVPGDLTEESPCDELIDKTVAEFGRVDVLVNNAAHQMAQPGGISDITTEQFDRVMRTNLYAMFWMCKKALPHMAAGLEHHQHLLGPGLPPRPSSSTTPRRRPGSRTSPAALPPCWARRASG